MPLGKARAQMKTANREIRPSQQTRGSHPIHNLLPAEIERFDSLAELALDGVSRLHGNVSRHLFEPLFPLWPADEVPVRHVTNGVHTPNAVRVELYGGPQGQAGHQGRGEA